MVLYTDKFKNVYSEQRKEGDNTLSMALYHNGRQWVALVVIEIQFVVPEGKPAYKSDKHIVQGFQGSRSESIKRAITIFDNVDIREAVKNARKKLVVD